MSQAAPGQRERFVVIGNFDGVHRGHRGLLERAASEASQRGLVPTVLTFFPHPAVALGREAPVRLTSQEDKLSLLRSIAPELDIITWEFTRETAALSPEQFAESVLRDALSARVVLVGENFRFGVRRSGDLGRLQELGVLLGFDAEAQEILGDELGPFTSTRVREALAAGDVEGAAQVLGRHHFVAGDVAQGDGRGRRLGIPTANLTGVSVVIPKDGVYAGSARLADGRRAAAVMNLGPRPTFSAPGALEAHLLDFSGDLYGARLTVEFHHRLRDTMKFSGPGELLGQIARDIERARQLLGAAAARPA